MAEPQCLEPEDLNRLVKALKKQVKHLEVMVFAQINKGDAKRESGVVGATDNNICEADWALAWDMLAEQPEIRLIRGIGKKSVYEWSAAMAPLAELPVNKDLTKPEIRVIAQKLKEAVENAHCSGLPISVNGARKAAMLAARIRIDLHSRLWGPIMKVAGSAPNAVVSVDKEYLTLKETDSPIQREMPVSAPASIVSTPVEILPKPQPLIKGLQVEVVTKIAFGEEPLVISAPAKVTLRISTTEGTVLTLTTAELSIEVVTDK